jgi:CubicO group peptidase (beta-lactamase class C family)
VGSLDARGGPAPDPERAVYRIGALTKLLTGIALLELQDAGRLDLDDSVTRFVPELSPRLDQVTLRHLVTHTSGIPSAGDRSAPYWQQTPVSEEQLLNALVAPLEFSPGTRSAYSNAGMALAGLVVARAAGESYRDSLQRQVLGPLGMTHVAWDRDAVPEEHLAIGVGPDGSVDTPHWQLGAFEAAGGLYCSLEDLSQLARFALSDFPKLLSPGSFREALTDHELPGQHGVGWIVGAREGYGFVTHTGSTSDYSASLFVLPERRVAGIVLQSGADAELAECAARALAYAVARGTTPVSCVPTLLDAASLQLLDSALSRLRALLAEPSDEKLQELLSPGFLQKVPRNVIDDVLNRIRATYGNCDAHEVLGRGGLGVRAVLLCSGKRLSTELHLEEAPPHRIDGLLFPGL